MRSQHCVLGRVCVFVCVYLRGGTEEVVFKGRMVYVCVCVCVTDWKGHCVASVFILTKINK